MTDAADARVSPRRTSPRRTSIRVDPATTMFATALVVAALIVPTLGALLVDERTIHDANIWDKPLKFELSLIIHLVTLGLVIGAIAPRLQSGWLVRSLTLVTVVSALGEVLYIVLQAARGRASHFNFETPIEIAMYSVMGVGAVLLVVCAFAFGVAVARAPRDGLGQGARLGIVLGLTVGASLTLVIAGLMSSGVVDGPGHWIGGVRSDARSLPLVGWSTTGGDLRVPHFFATHLMQALPLLGLAGDRIAPRTAKTLVYAGTAVGFAIVAATFAQALMGQPLLPL